MPRADQGSEITADAITRLSAKAFSLIEEATTRQHALLQKAELSKTVSQFDSDMMIASQEIRQQFLSDPDAGVQALHAKRQELFNQYKDTISDPDVKLSFDAFGSETLAQSRARDMIWAFNEKNKIIQQNHFDRLKQDADFAVNTDSLDEVLKKAQMIDADRESFYQAWGGVKAGSEVIDKGQEGLIKAYFYGQLSKGNAFKVLREIEDGRLGPTEGSNGLISSIELKGMKAEAKRMALAGQKDAAALALVDAVQTGFDIDGALEQPISATEENINALSFSIAQKKELVARGEADEKEVQALEGQQKLLEKVRAAQMSRNDMYIVPDPAVEADMTARFSGLFKKGKPGKPFTATLEEIFQFQLDLMDNRNVIEPKLFSKLSKLTEKSFQDEIQGFVKSSKFKTKKSMFGLGPLVAEDKKQLSTSKKLQGAFSELISRHDPELGNQDLFETMQIFFGDLDELVNLDDAPAMEAVDQKILNGLIVGAERKMQLKRMGLPVFMGEKDVIYNNGVGYEIVGWDTDGMPLLEPR